MIVEYFEYGNGLYRSSSSSKGPGALDDEAIAAGRL